MTGLVFDNTCLSHFARAGRLELLDAITSLYERLTPNEVMTEVFGGISAHPALGQLIVAQWFAIVELNIGETVRAVQFKAELGGDPTRDLGECAVLALAESHGAVAVIDDHDGAALGRRHGVIVVGTLAVICGALKRGTIDKSIAEILIDELAATDMHLPVDGAGLIEWCHQHEKLP